MEILYSGKYVEFEWDSDKAELNFDKHDVSFFEACEACEDPNFVYADDDPREYGEDRERVIGKTSERRVLFVVHVERGSSVRIISARKANGRERELYERRNRWP